MASGRGRVCLQARLSSPSEFITEVPPQQVGTGRGYVEHSRDPASLQTLPSGGVKCTTQKEGRGGGFQLDHPRNYKRQNQ